MGLLFYFAFLGGFVVVVGFRSLCFAWNLPTAFQLLALLHEVVHAGLLT